MRARVVCVGSCARCGLLGARARGPRGAGRGPGRRHAARPRPARGGALEDARVPACAAGRVCVPRCRREAARRRPRAHTRHTVTEHAVNRVNRAHALTHGTLMQTTIMKLTSHHMHLIISRDNKRGLLAAAPTLHHPLKSFL